MARLPKTRQVTPPIPRLRGPPDVLGTGNADTSPRLRENIPVPTPPVDTAMLQSPPPDAVAATPPPPPDVIREQQVKDTAALNPDAQVAPGTTGATIFATEQIANERTLEAQRRLRAPLISGGMDQSMLKYSERTVTDNPNVVDATNATRARLDRLQATRPDSWMYDAHIAAKVQGASDQPPTTGPDGTYDEFLRGRYQAVQNDQALDTVTRPQFDQIAASNPIAAANGQGIGNTWRTVQAMGGADVPQQPDGKAPPSNPNTVGLPWGKAYPDVGTMLSEWTQGAAGAANELLGVTPAQGQVVPRTARPAQPELGQVPPAQRGAPPPTPNQAITSLTNGNRAPPPPVKGPLDAAWGVAGDVARITAANSIDAVARVAPGAYAAVKAGLDAIDGITSAAAGAAGKATGIQFLQDYAKGGLGLPEANAIFGEPATPAGAVSQNISQFLVGWYTGGKLLSSLGLAEGGGAMAQGTRLLAQGAVTDAGFFEGQQGKLADLLVKVPALNTPVTQFLATAPTDTEAEGRLKNALNGIVAAPLVPALIGAIRGVRAGGQMLGVLRGAQTATDAAAGAAPKVPTSLLGDATPDAPVTMKAPEVAAPQVPPETRGGGVQYHGTNQANLAPSSEFYTTKNYYGQGFYSTDAVSIAGGYATNRARRGGAPIVYSVKDNRPLQIYDMEQPLTPDLMTAIRADSKGTTGGFLQDVLDGTYGEKPTTLRQLYVEVRSNSAGEDISADTTQEIFTGINDSLQKLGYDGMSHVGGALTKNEPHKVVIYFNPEKDVTLTPTATDWWKRPDAAAGKIATAQGEVAAAEATAPSTTVPAGSTAIGGGPDGGPQVFANFAAIKTPDDIQKIANDMVAAYEGTTDAARQGVISNAATKATAGELDAFDTLMQRRTGTAPSAAEVYAWKSLYMGSLTKLQEVARRASTAPLDEAPKALLEMRQMESLVLAIQKDFYGARAESGRALQAFQIPADSVFQAKQIETLLNQYGGLDVNADLARKIAAVNDTNSLADFVTQSAFSKGKDAWQQFFYFNVLSSPKTHIRNFVGNSVMMGLNLAETGLAGQFARAMGDQDAVAAGEALANWTGIKMAFGDALQAAGRTMRTGETSGGYGLNKIDFPQRNAISADAWGVSQSNVFASAIDALGAVTQTTGRALMASDEFFKTVGASGTGYQYAFRQAQQELARGAITTDQVANRVTQLVTDFPNRLDDPTRAAVADKAAYLTFTTAPKPGGWVDLLLKARSIGDQPDASLISKAGGFAARIELPFANTPSNIMLATFERTPLAPLTARYRDAMAKGGADAYVANSRMALGSMAMATWMDLYLNGTVTGQGPPANSAEYQTMYAAGWRPYSIKIGGHYVSYQGIEPLSTVLGWSAAIGDVLANTESSTDPTASTNLERATAASLFAMADVMLSKSYLQSSADLLDAINGGQTSSAEYFVKKYGAGLVVPNVARDVTSMMDPVQRYTTSLFDEIKSRTPGLSSTLPPRRDAFGFVKSYQSGFGAAYDAISPFYAAEIKNMPIASAMLKDGWAVSAPQMAFTIDGQRVDVSGQPAIYSRFLELRGQVRPSDLVGTVNPNYLAPDRYASGEAAQGWSDRLKDRYGNRNMVETLNGIVSEAPPADLRDQAERYHSFVNVDDRRRFILSIVSDYQDAAKSVLFYEHPELLARAAQNKAAGQVPQP